MPVDSQPVLEIPTDHTTPTDYDAPVDLAPPAYPARPAEHSTVAADPGPIVTLQRAVRRQQAFARNPREDLVWQARFAYSSAGVILFAFAVVSLPLWLVLYRISGTFSNDGAGPRVADLVALCMMLMGGFLTSAATWVIIIEMRGRVRMVDTLAKTGEREAMAAPELPILDAPPARATPLISASSASSTSSARDSASSDIVSSDIAPAVDSQPFNPAATIEASSKLLASFSSVLRSFGQLAAQVAMLAVALALFVGATILSLR
jgi:hypothetical protein